MINKYDSFLSLQIIFVNCYLVDCVKIEIFRQKSLADLGEID